MKKRLIYISLTALLLLSLLTCAACVNDNKGTNGDGTTESSSIPVEENTTKEPIETGDQPETETVTGGGEENTGLVVDPTPGVGDEVPFFK